jgi:WD40 repeat protein
MLVVRGRNGGGTLQVYATSGRAVTQETAYAGLLDAASFSPGGRLVAVAIDSRVEVRDAQTLDPTHSFEAHSGQVLGVAFAGTDHDLLWTAGRDGTAAALDLTGRRGIFRSAATDVAPHTGTVSASGNRAAVVTFYPDRPNPASVVNLRTGRSLSDDLPVPECVCQVEAVTIDESGTRVIGTLRRFGPEGDVPNRGDVLVWSADSTLTSDIALPWPGYGIAVTPDGSRAVINGRAGIAVVNIEAGRLVSAPISATPIEARDGMPTVAVSRDGRTAAVARDNLVLLVDIASGRERARFELAERDQITSLAFSADGETLVAGQLTGDIRFLSSRTFDAVAPTRHVAAGFVLNVTVSPDGRFLASLGTDGDLLLWDTATWTPYGKPLSDNHGWGVLGFTADSRRLRVLYEDRTRLEMSVVPNEWVEQACQAANRDLTRAESTVVRPGEPLRPTCAQVPR